MIASKMGLMLVASIMTAHVGARDLKSEPVAPEPKAYKETIKGGLASKGVVLGMQELPISKFFFVEAEQGNYIISSDGRFVFEGTLKDVWHRRTIKSVQDVVDTQRTPVSNLGFKPEEQLAYFVVGNTKIPRQGVAFVDPTSEYTQKFLKLIQEQKDTSNWTIVLMPLVGGNQAVDRSLRLWCAVDRDQARLDLIYGTSKSFQELQEGCNDEKIVMGMMLTDLFRITSLPHLMREDGLVSHGYPQDFQQWFIQP